MDIIVTSNFKPVKPPKPELESVTLTVSPALAKLINVMLWSFTDTGNVTDQYRDVIALSDALDNVVGKGCSYGYQVDGSIQLKKD